MHPNELTLPQYRSILLTFGLKHSLDIFLRSLIYLEEIEGIDQRGTKQPRTSFASAGSSERAANKCLRVIGGQRNKSSENYSFLPCLVISICPPRTTGPSITVHSWQDSCLGVKHIHSSAVHQIAPNTVILHSHRAAEAGGGARGKCIKEAVARWSTLFCLKHFSLAQNFPACRHKRLLLD